MIMMMTKQTIFEILIFFDPSYVVLLPSLFVSFLSYR